MSLADLSPEQRRQAVIRLSRFVLRTGVGEIRDEVQENVVEMALFLRPEASSFDDIASILKDELVVDFPRPVLKSVLSRLQQKNLVSVDGTYRLSPARRKEMENQVNDYTTAWQKVLEQLTSSTEQYLGRKCSAEERELIVETWLGFISSLFIDHAHISAQLITGRPAIESPPIALEMLDRSLDSIHDPLLKKSTKSAMLDTLGNPSENVASVLSYLDRNLVCIQVLNLDPECQALERSAFSNVTLLLDTNVIISLLCPTSRQHALTEELIDLTRHLGANLKFTKRTASEFIDVLDDANKRFQGLRIPQRFLTSLDDEFIASFANEKEQSPHLTWEGYYLSIKELESILKNRYGIGLLGADYDEIPRLQFFGEISQRVSECYKKLRGWKKKLKVAEHDAYHLLLVRELRKSETTTILGTSCWFLTLDQTLPFVDPLVTEKLQCESKTMSAMPVEIWLQMIQPFLIGRVESQKTVQVFLDLLRSQFSEVPFRISMSTIAELQGDWLNTDWLQTEDIEKILGEKFVSDYISKIEEEPAMSDEERKKLAGEVAHELEVRVDSIATQKIEQLTANLKDLNTKLGEGLVERNKLRQELVEETKFRRKWMTVSGVLGALLIGMGLIVGISMVTMVTAQSALSLLLAFGLLVVGGILLYFAIAPEKAKVGMQVSLSPTGKDS